VNPSPGWYSDPDNTDQLRWWDGRSWSPSTAPVPVDGTAAARDRWWGGEPSSTAPAAVDRSKAATIQPAAPANVPREAQAVAQLSPRRIGGFPFTKPWLGDWVFWWAVAVMLLSVVALTIANPGDTSGVVAVGFVVDLTIGLAGNFAVFVLPVAGLRSLFRSRRSGKTHLTSSVRVVPLRTASSPARQVSVRIDGGEIIFRRAGDGRVDTTAWGLGQPPPPQTVARARAAVVERQRQQGEPPWF
jgi:hypothetical protein